jgi:anti-sigma B factor antagonist
LTAQNLDPAIAIDGASPRVILDMREVTYVTSAGLRAIVRVAKRAQDAKGAIAIFGLRAVVKDVFEVAGFVNIIPIVSDETEALAKLGA